MIETKGEPFQIMVTQTTAKAAVGSENQLMVCVVRSSRISTQFIRPKDESKIQAKMTTAMTSGTAQGSATKRRAMARPRKRLLTRSADARPSAKQADVT